MTVEFPDVMPVEVTGTNWPYTNIWKNVAWVYNCMVYTTVTVISTLLQILESPNPFTYSDSASEVKSKVISMTMKNPDGTPMEVAGTDDPIEMWIPGKPSLVPPARKFSFLTSASSEKVELNYHSIVVTTNNTGMHIIIRPESPDDRYRVFLKYMDFPNETYNDWVGEVPTEEVSADSYRQCLNWCTLSTWRTVQHQARVRSCE